MPVLKVQSPQQEPFEFEIEGESAVIGRSSECDLSLSERFLSRRHARFFRESDTWMIEDLGSRNGTLVGGVAIGEPTPLFHGAEITLSGVSILVELPGQPGPPAAATCSSPQAQGASDRAGHDFGDHTVFRSASNILSDIQEATAAGPTMAIDTYAERLRIVNEVHEALSSSVSVDELLELILDRVFAHLMPQSGAIFLRKGDEIVRAHSRMQSGRVEEFPESTSLVGEVVDKGLAALVADMGSDERFSGAESILSSGVRSLVAAPLLTSEGASGMIVLSSNLAHRVFSEEDMELLVSLASAAAMHIRNAALALEAAERRRLEREVELARRIQSALLPKEMPEVEGLEIFGTNEPSRGVSGDYYQVMDDESHGLVLLVADVSGKGIGASLLTSYVDALSLAYIGEGFAPEEVFSRVSPQMNAKTPPDKFATAFLAYLDRSTGAIRYCSGGHDPALIVRASGETDWLNPTGIPLGLMPNVAYEPGEGQLGLGDSLILYTDGIAEAINPEEEEYGRPRLEKVCVEHRDSSATELAHAIQQDVEIHANGQPYHDDRTLVVVKRVG